MKLGDNALGGPESQDIWSELSSSIPSNDVEILDLLERVERENPEFAAERLMKETDEFLGRTHAQTPDQTASKSAKGKKHRAKRLTFLWFAQMVGGAPLLDSERTVRAAKAVEVGLLAEERLQSLDRNMVSRQELRELYTLIEHGRAEFRLLVVSNLRLVFHWSKGVASTLGLDWAQDAFQAGCLGLIRGLWGWDYARGYALSTFVSWHIRQSIQRWRANEVLLIRLPAHVWERLDSAERKLTPEIITAADRAQNIYPLEEISLERADLTWDGGLDLVDDSVDQLRIIDGLFATLTEREAFILSLRFGLSSGGEPQTLDRIGEELGVTRERIRQIENKSLKSLRALVTDPSDWLHLF